MLKLKSHIMSAVHVFMLLNTNQGEIYVLQYLSKRWLVEREMLSSVGFILQVWVCSKRLPLVSPPVSIPLLSQLLCKSVPVHDPVNELKPLFHVLIELVINNPIKITAILLVNLGLLSSHFQILDLLIQRLNHPFISFDRFKSKLATRLVVGVVDLIQQQHLLLCFQFYHLVISLANLSFKVAQLSVLWLELLLEICLISTILIACHFPQSLIFLIHLGGNICESNTFIEEFLCVCLYLGSIISTSFSSFSSILSKFTESIVVKSDFNTHFILLI